MESRLAIYSIVEGIRGQYPKDKVRVAFSLFMKMMTNIIHNPYDPKFRYLNLSNEAVKTKILVIPEMIVLAKECGFEQADKITLVFNQITFDSLQLGINSISPIVENMEENIRLKSYEKLDPKIAKLQEELEIKLQEEKASRQKVLNQIENDKLERAKKKSCGPSIATYSSKANNRNFKKFHPNKEC